MTRHYTTAITDPADLDGTDFVLGFGAGVCLCATLVAAAVVVWAVRMNRQEQADE